MRTKAAFSPDRHSAGGEGGAIKGRLAEEFGAFLREHWERQLGAGPQPDADVSGKHEKR